MGPELMLNLMRDLREQNGELPRLELSTQSIVDEAFEIALLQYLGREQNPMLQDQEASTMSQNGPRQPWPNTILQNHESGTMSQHALHQSWGTEYLRFPEYPGQGLHQNLSGVTAFTGLFQPAAFSLGGADFTPQPFQTGPSDLHPPNHGYEESQDLQGFVIDPAEVPVAFDSYAIDTS
jgi:hypothetical protein